jgi:hypothetical protein
MYRTIFKKLLRNISTRYQYILAFCLIFCVGSSQVSTQLFSLETLRMTHIICLGRDSRNVHWHKHLETFALCCHWQEIVLLECFISYSYISCSCILSWRIVELMLKMFSAVLCTLISYTACVWHYVSCVLRPIIVDFTSINGYLLQGLIFYCISMFKCWNNFEVIYISSWG